MARRPPERGRFGWRRFALRSGSTGSRASAWLLSAITPRLPASDWLMRAGLANRRARNTPAADPAAGPRFAALDVVRGLALCGMVLFHFDWDLAYLHWREAGPASSPLWTAFGHLVAATFLFLSGWSLVLAAPAGPKHALRRLAVIGAAALTITAVTYVVFPGDCIFSGILHCIVVTNIIALALLRAPLGVVLAAAVAAGLAPFVLSSSRFDGPWWWWLGLSQSLPHTLDYRPVLPWLAVVLLGTAIARLRPRVSAWRPGTLPPRMLAWAGRHSLPLYLLHQPVLLGLLLLASPARLPAPADWASDFTRRCRAECTATGAGFEGCRAACECVRLRLGPGPDRNGAPATETKELQDVGADCVAASFPDPGRTRSPDEDP